MSKVVQGSLTMTGPVLIGMGLNWGLLGTLSSQVYVYALTYPNDSVRVKVLVTGLFLLEIVQTIFCTHYAWSVLVAGWGTATFDTFFPWSSATLPLMCGIISLIVQVYYAWRIWVLRVSSKYPSFWQVVAILIVMVAILQCTMALYGGIAFMVSRTFERMSTLGTVVEIWLVGSVTCDVMIAASMITILKAAGRGAPWKHTAALVNGLVIHAIETGAVTAVTAVIDLVLYHLFQNSTIHQVPTQLLGKLYTNALMVSLNGRHRRQAQLNPSQLNTLSQFRIETTDISSDPQDMLSSTRRTSTLPNDDSILVKGSTTTGTGTTTTATHGSGGMGMGMGMGGDSNTVSMKYESPV